MEKELIVRLVQIARRYGLDVEGEYEVTPSLLHYRLAEGVTLSQVVDGDYRDYELFIHMLGQTTETILDQLPVAPPAEKEPQDPPTPKRRGRPRKKEEPNE